MTYAERHFFDVPVYRLCEERYYRDMEQHIDNVMFPPEDQLSNALREMDRINPSENDAARGHVATKYGGSWQFNEIVGYIRLFFLGSQVRGEYYASGQKRICRTRRKIFQLKSLNLAPEIEIGDLTSNVAILDAVLEYLSHCRKELKGRYVDSELLDNLGPFIDWQSVLRSD